jgi:siroheme synthase
MAEAARDAEIASPAIIVVGDVADLAATNEAGAAAQAVSRIAAGGVHT